jgi:hypothetical protein
MITALGFTTRDRPELLRRCVESFVDNCRSYGRYPRLIVMDDAIPGTHASARPTAERLAREYPDFPVCYAGAAEKRAYAGALARAGLPGDVLQFALLDPERCGYSLGANRNALQLETLGEQVVYVDDDCVAATARPPSWSDELAVTGPHSTQEYWFYPDHASALAAARFEAADLLGLHEAYLGKACGALMAAASNGGSRPTPWFRLMRDHAHVKVTQNGVVGDSCMFSNIGHLLHGGPASRSRLARSDTTLATAMTSREIIRSASRPTLRLGGLLIGPDYACDQSSILPPYFPVFRASDTSFSNLLSLAFPAYAFADIPWLVTHDALPGRRYNNRGYSERWRCSAGETIRALLFVEAAGAYRSVSDPLSTVGDRLVGFGRMAGEDFAHLVRSQVDALIARKADRLERLLAGSDPESVHYADALRQSLANLGASTSDPLRWLPVELDRGGGPADTMARLQRLTRRFGELLQRWKSVDEAARSLAVAGVKLAVPL